MYKCIYIYIYTHIHTYITIKHIHAHTGLGTSTASFTSMTGPDKPPNNISVSSYHAASSLYSGGNSANIGGSSLTFGGNSLTLGGGSSLASSDSGFSELAALLAANSGSESKVGGNNAELKKSGGSCGQSSSIGAEHSKNNTNTSSTANAAAAKSTVISSSSSSNPVADLLQGITRSLAHIAQPSRPSSAQATQNQNKEHSTNAANNSTNNNNNNNNNMSKSTSSIHSDGKPRTGGDADKAPRFARSFSDGDREPSRVQSVQSASEADKTEFLAGNTGGKNRSGANSKASSGGSYRPQRGAEWQVIGVVEKMVVSPRGSMDSQSQSQQSGGTEDPDGFYFWMPPKQRERDEGLSKSYPERGLQRQDGYTNHGGAAKSTSMYSVVKDESAGRVLSYSSHASSQRLDESMQMLRSSVSLSGSQGMRMDDYSRNLLQSSFSGQSRHNDAHPGRQLHTPYSGLDTPSRFSITDTKSGSVHPLRASYSGPETYSRQQQPEVPDIKPNAMRSSFSGPTASPAGSPYTRYPPGASASHTGAENRAWLPDNTRALRASYPGGNETAGLPNSSSSFGSMDNSRRVSFSKDESGRSTSGVVHTGPPGYSGLDLRIDSNGRLVVSVCVCMCACMYVCMGYG